MENSIAKNEQLRTEVIALLQERSTKAIKIHWQFSIQTARSKFNRHYTRVNQANQKQE